MKDDNTPTVTSRRRKPTPHQRLRLEKAKELKKLGVLSKKKRAEVKKQKPGETDPEKMVSIAPRIPKMKENALSKPIKPPAKFRKRQIHKSWLPTHLYHAKRAHMTPPKEPLWRFAIPLTPTDKCYRATHRAISSRGCVAWDMSYIGTIGIEGVESSLLGLLRSVGVEEDVLTGKRHAKWRRGTRWWESWIRERDGEKQWITKVGIVWCLEAVAADVPTTDNAVGNDTGDQQPTEAPETKLRQGDRIGHTQEPKAPRRKLLIRVHPSAFFETWKEILKVAKIQRPAVAVEDLRFEVGSLEIAGPESTQALVGVLHPASALPEASSDEWEDFETSEQVWRQLAGVTNSASLPLNAILGFNVCDPRLHHPPRTVEPSAAVEGNDALLEILSTWPPDKTNTYHDIFNRTKRLTASRQLSSQKAVNRRKSEALPGEYPTPSPRDPRIPILLMASRTTVGQGSWTLLLPWNCVLPVWYSLMHYPLYSGGNPRFGGLQERRQIAFEQNLPWFPADCPGTKAGFAWELSERERKKKDWEKRPKGKKYAWESVDLGDGKKGELGLGWACDWERLFQGPASPPNTECGNKTTSQALAGATGHTVSERSRLDTIAHAKGSPIPMQPPLETQDPPLNIHHLTAQDMTVHAYPPTALSPIHLTLVTAGHPTRNARIYRLPTTNSELRARWLALAQPKKVSRQPRSSHRAQNFQKNATSHERAQDLATHLLAPPLSQAQNDSAPLKAGDPAYPYVPDEIDLIGFVTTGNYHLGEGKHEAIGNIAPARVMGEDTKGVKGSERNLCIVRESGQGLGRLARWKFV